MFGTSKHKQVNHIVVAFFQEVLLDLSPQYFFAHVSFFIELYVSFRNYASFKTFSFPQQDNPFDAIDMESDLLFDRSSLCDLGKIPDRSSIHSN